MIQTCNLVPRCILQHTSPHQLLPILLLLLRTWWGSCHPQCLDYKPPFEPRQPLAFCKEYSKFGCCDVEKDEEISGRFYNIMENFDHSGYAACGKYVRSILCQVRETFILIWFDLFDLMSIRYKYSNQTVLHMFSLEFKLMFSNVCIITRFYYAILFYLLFYFNMLSSNLASQLWLFTFKLKQIPLWFVLAGNKFYYIFPTGRYKCV